MMQKQIVRNRSRAKHRSRKR